MFAFHRLAPCIVHVGIRKWPGRRVSLSAGYKERRGFAGVVIDCSKKLLNPWQS